MQFYGEEPVVASSLDGRSSMSWAGVYDPGDADLKATDTGADKALPSITAVKFPSDVTPTYARLMVKYREIEDESGADNYITLDGTEHIQFRQNAGTYIDAIQLVAKMLQVNAGTRSSGDVMIGAIDITGELFSGVNGTYNVQWENFQAFADGLSIHDLQTILQVWF